MTGSQIVVSCLFGWLIVSIVVSPVIAARVGGRPMTPHDRALVGWGGLGVFMALFLLAVLVIGTP